MLNLIMGTAGHIDHGKTALIKVLTGIDCDTHPEEKKRGITINLGFAFLKFKNGNTIGIVDVPGHKDFINTMVAGASGINFILLVIAADEGIMPQTIEHVRIIQSLGIKNCVIALTKIDLVDDQIINLAENEINQLMLQYDLKVFSIVKVSAITGEGIEKLKDVILNISNEFTEIKRGEIFRLFIDRIFSVKGYGTVVTGSVLGGQIKKEDSVYLLPSAEKVKIRKMEKYYEEVNQINAGNRAAINLTGIKKEYIKKGNVLTDRLIKQTTIIDAKIKIFPDSQNIKLWSQAVLLLGTNVSQVKIHLIDRNELFSGESAIAQIHFEYPSIIIYKDKFILRNTAGNKTIGCGEVFDAYPLLHKRRPEKLIKVLINRANGGLKEFLYAELEKCGGILSLKKVLNELDISQIELRKFIQIQNVIFNEIPFYNNSDDSYIISTNLNEKITNRLISNIQSFHTNNSLDDGGRTLEELNMVIKKQIGLLDIAFLENLLKFLEDQNILKKIRNTWALSNHYSILSDKDKDQINHIVETFKHSGMHTLLENEIISEAQKFNIDKSKLTRILKYLTRKKLLYKIEESYIYSEIVNNCRNKLTEHFSSNDNCITVAGFRDLVQGNRKTCLLLLKLYDREGITYRDGDYRKPVTQL